MNTLGYQKNSFWKKLILLKPNLQHSYSILYEISTFDCHYSEKCCVGAIYLLSLSAFYDAGYVMQKAVNLFHLISTNQRVEFYERAGQ